MIQCTRTDQAPHAAIIFPGTSASNKSLSLSLICRAGRIFQRSRRVCRVKLLIPLEGKSPRFFRRARGYRCWCFRIFGKDPVEVGRSCFIPIHPVIPPGMYLEPWNLSKHQIPGGITGCTYRDRLTYISLSRRSLAFYTSKYCENCLVMRSWWSERIWNHVKLLNKNRCLNKTLLGDDGG